MRNTLFIFLFGVLIYLGFATVLGTTELMGSFGVSFASFNHQYFGYLSYIYLFVLLYPLYQLYKNVSFDFRKAELTIASVLILFSSMLAQALLIENEFRGKFGADFVDFLSPYIGLFGLWVFWFVISAVSIVIVFEKDASDLFDHIVAYFAKKTAKKEVAVAQKEFDDEPPFDLDEPQERVYEPEVEEEYSYEDTKETAPKVDISIDTSVIEEEIDKPAFLRQNPNKKQSILDLAKEVKEQKTAVIVEELEENKKLMADIEIGETKKPKNFKLPRLDFLQKPPKSSKAVDESELDGKISDLIEKLGHFKIEGDVVRTYAGPVVSTFEFKPAANVKVSKILNLQDDLAMALSAETIRIQAPIPGKDVVGIEIPNDTVETIYLRELLDDKLFQNSSSPLTIALGKDIVGKPFVTDLKKLPHLLIAGTTGSGKSVGINAMILSLLYKNSPDQLRLLMIDPKMLEFSMYNDIPHLLTPVITKPKQAIVALNNMVAEMERRYELMAESRTKNIENYNAKVEKEGGEHFPFIVVIIDELADLMMTSGKDVEISIARLAQKSRACGIHLIVATQRPSVDVVTGLIKANLPSRISYRVGQKVDSKIILDQMGAESLLGRGDMLFTPPGAPALVRLHAPWATEDEIDKIVEFIKSQREPNYDKSFLVEDSENDFSGSNETYEELDPLFEEAKSVILTDRKTSISYLQRKLQIGYNRSARVIEQLEQEGILSAPNAKGIREIL